MHPTGSRSRSGHWCLILSEGTLPELLPALRFSRLLTLKTHRVGVLVKVIMNGENKVASSLPSYYGARVSFDDLERRCDNTSAKAGRQEGNGTLALDGGDGSNAMRYLWTLSSCSLLLHAVLGKFDYYAPIKPGIEWQPCHDGMDCGFFEMPLDWRNSSAGRGRLAVTRYNATRERKGVLFVNGGALPALPTGWFGARAEAIAENVVDGSFDIVTWDVRGMQGEAESGDFHTIPAPLSCFSNSREEGQFWWGMMTRHLDTPWNNSTDFHERGDMTLYIDRYEALAEYPRRCHSMQQSVHPDILRYMGTAASVRDLIALADYLQGPGTPVNFWGISSGALIGSYMINMFPERVGRVILDSPADPSAYTSKFSHLVFEDDVTAAHEAFMTFEKNCAQGECRLVHGNWTNEQAREYPQHVLSLVRTLYMGWRTTLGMDYHDEWLQNFARSTSNGTGEPPVDLREWISHLHKLQQTFDISRTVSMTATFCGDHDDYDQAFATTETLIRRFNEFGTTAPLLGRMFPAGHYLCHLWPTRAVERYNGPWDHAPANPVVILGNKLNPFSSFKNAKAVADTMGSSAVLLEQDGFGYTFSPHTPSPHVAAAVSAYLLNGILPSDMSIHDGKTHSQKAFSLL